MALTTTTLTAAVAVTDKSIVVSSATGAAVNTNVLIDQELFVIAKGYDGSSTTIPVYRGQQGSVTAAHANTANVTFFLGSDESAQAGQTSVQWPLARPRTISSYVASGAIALPAPGSDAIAILTGTSTLAMTLANPTKDMDGTLLFIVGSGKSASTIDFPDATGLSGAGSSYDTITFQNGGQCCLTLLAINAAWVLVGPTVTGTTTALAIAIA